MIKMFFIKVKKKMVNIEGMTCEHCAKKVEDALENLVDVAKAKVDLKKKRAIVTYDNTVDEILLTDTIEKLGYTVTGIKEAS